MFLCCLLVLPALTLPVRAASGDVSDIKDGDILQFGQADDSIGFTAEWIVLDADHTNTGENGIFLLSKDLIGSDTENGMLAHFLTILRCILSSSSLQSASGIIITFSS